jgi:hypothetical protein
VIADQLWTDQTGLLACGDFTTHDSRDAVEFTHFLAALGVHGRRM